MSSSDSTPQGPNRRRHLRVAPPRSLRIALEGPSGTVARGLAVNVSEGGACVATQGEPLLEDQEIIARISFTAHPPAVQAGARVAWAELAPEQKEGRYGLQWTGRGFQRDRLAALIRSVFPPIE